jgi:hypothetical protein
MEADIHGLQRKVVSCGVRPLKACHGAAGIPLERGRTLPFVVRREWSAPAGHYPERWYLVVPDSGEVLFEGPERPELLIWGLQSMTEVTDEVMDPLSLGPGTYLMVFALGGVKGGEMEVEAVEIGATANA